MNANSITNILGAIVILSAIVSVFTMDDIGWPEASIGMLTGGALIWFKNNSAKELIKSIINFKYGK